MGKIGRRHGRVKQKFPEADIKAAVYAMHQAYQDTDTKLTRGKVNKSLGVKLSNFDFKIIMESLKQNGLLEKIKSPTGNLFFEKKSKDKKPMMEIISGPKKLGKVQKGRQSPNR